MRLRMFQGLHASASTARYRPRGLWCVFWFKEGDGMDSLMVRGDRVRTLTWSGEYSCPVPGIREESLPLSHTQYPQTISAPYWLAHHKCYHFPSKSSLLYGHHLPKSTLSP